jgi:hypothetical protein
MPLGNSKVQVAVSRGSLNLAVTCVATLSAGCVALILSVNCSLYGDSSSMKG